MRAYKEELLQNSMLVNESEAFQQAGFISKEQLRFIESTLPHLQQSSHLAARIGLWLLGFILFIASTGAIFMFFRFEVDAIEVLLMLAGMLGFVLLEGAFIRGRNYYAHGIEEAFLFCSQGCVLSAVSIMTEMRQPEIFYLLATLLGAVCCLRYADGWSAFLTLLGFFSLLAYPLSESGPVLSQTMPLLGLAVAGGFFMLHEKLRHRLADHPYYSNSLTICLLCAAALFYCSLNLYVVAESEFCPDVTASNFGTAVFLITTLLSPVVLLWFALRRHHRPLLWLGILAAGFSVFTVRYYFSVMPLEAALLIGGAVLFGLSYFWMTKLKEKQTGLTFNPDRFQASANDLDFEKLVLLHQSMAGKQLADTSSTAQFGGGDFGGGGSGNRY